MAKKRQIIAVNFWLCNFKQYLLIRLVLDSESLKNNSLWILNFSID